MPPLEDEIRQVEHEARTLRGKAQRLVAFFMRPHKIAVALFMRDGRLTPEAVQWFAWLAREAYVDSSTFNDDPREHARREGQRELALKIMRSVHLDTRKLARLNEQLKEAGYD